MTSEEYRRYLLMMNQWLILKQERKDISRYLINHGYRRVAIYGMGLYGRHIVRDLAGSEVTIAFGIDRTETESYMGVEIIKPKKELKGIDLVIISALRYSEEIRDTLKDICDCDIVELDQLVLAAYNNG